MQAENARSKSVDTPFVYGLCLCFFLLLLLCGGVYNAVSAPILTGGRIHPVNLDLESEGPWCESMTGAKAHRPLTPFWWPGKIGSTFRKATQTFGISRR
jgi:hypothetical protein